MGAEGEAPWAPMDIFATQFGTAQGTGIGELVRERGAARSWLNDAE